MNLPGYIHDALAVAVRAVAASIGTPGAAELAADAERLSRAPAELAAALVAAVAELDDDTRLEALAGDGVSLPAVPATTSWRRVQRDREAALVVLVRAAATSALARRSAARAYPYQAAAVERRDTLAERLDALEDDAGDELFVALRDLRTALIAHVRAILPDLARLVDVTPRTTLPSLVIAYELTESVEDAGDLAIRARVPRPGFVPPSPLRVLAS